MPELSKSLSLKRGRVIFYQVKRAPCEVPIQSLSFLVLCRMTESAFQVVTLLFLGLKFSLGLFS